MVEATATVSGLGSFPFIAATATRTAAISATNLSAAAPLTSSARSERAGSSLFLQDTDMAATQVLTDLDLQVQLSIARLKADAARVLRERSAQLAAGAGYVRGGASFAYTIGPDGQLYATGVLLSYDTSPVANDPAATISKMQQIRSAALASSNPTAADYAAAASATRVELQARVELAEAMAAEYLGPASAANVRIAGTLLSSFA